jgi:GNAT superfamily N-acetyltransferase
MPQNPTAWEARGITLEQLDVLSTNRKPNLAPLPEGYEARTFTDHDWDNLTAREVKEGISEGEYEPAVIERFVRETNRTRQGLCKIGAAAWFGAFFGNELVANLGIIKCGSTGRYQSVETQPAHRRKGLASHLLGLAASWSQEQGCEDWVIVTQETNDAGRVYRRAGFTPALASVNAYKKPSIK